MYCATCCAEMARTVWQWISLPPSPCVLLSVPLSLALFLCVNVCGVLGNIRYSQQQTTGPSDRLFVPKTRKKEKEQHLCDNSCWQCSQEIVLCLFMKHPVPVPSEKGSNETKRGRLSLASVITWQWREGHSVFLVLVIVVVVVLEDVVTVAIVVVVVVVEDVVVLEDVVAVVIVVCCWGCSCCCYYCLLLRILLLLLSLKM